MFAHTHIERTVAAEESAPTKGLDAPSPAAALFSLFCCFHVWQNVRSDNLVVNKFCTSGLWMIQPNDKSNLDDVVKRDVGENKVEDILTNAQGRKDYPVC